MSPSAVRHVAWRRPLRRRAVRASPWGGQRTFGAESPSSSRPGGDAIPGLAGGRSYDGLWANTSFEALGVHPALVQALAAQDILRPTVVQAEAFGPLCRGRDTILRAETGSGKTLAYLLPLVNRIYHLHDRARAAALADPDAPNPLQGSRPWVVLTPTSDLSAQVLAMLEAIDCDRLVAAQSLQRLFRWEAARPASQGGAPGSFKEPRLKERTLAPGQTGALAGNGQTGQAALYATQSPRIRWGSTDIVVSTPMKFCEDLEHFKEDGIYPACVVMDEADALFQGTSRLYLFDIFAALRPRPKIRQMEEERKPLPALIPTQFVFSAATMVHIGPFSEGNMLIERFCTAHTVETQHFHRLPAGIGPENVRWLQGSDDWNQRVDQLVEVLRSAPRKRTLIFVNSLHNCHVLLKFFRERGWPVASYMKGPQGRMGPRFRDARRFVDGEASIMIATEFGGRGIDWHQVDHVVNFQMPTSAICWLHRAGRTGRIGQQGLVSNFVASKDQAFSELIQAQLVAGKDFHSVFSRKRSLRRKLRRGHGAAENDDESWEDWSGGGAGGAAQGEGAPYRMDGGLELHPGAFPGRGTSAPEGDLIGYLSSPALDDGLSSSRPAKRSSSAPATAADQSGGDSAPGEADSLAQLRDRLLASDSESDTEGDHLSDDPEGDSVLDAEGSPISAAGRMGEQPLPAGRFSWSKLSERSEGAPLGPEPVRPLERSSGRRRQEETTKRAKRYLDQDGLPEGGARPGRKGLGVRARSQVNAGRNYASPDDELLL